MKDSMIHQARTLSALVEMSGHISSTLDHRDIANRCLHSLSENLELEKCALLMPSSREKELTVIAANGWTREEFGDGTIAGGDSAPAAVLASGMAIAVPDLGDLPTRPLPSPPKNQDDVVGYLAVPVVVNRRSIGVLTAFRTSNRTMLDEDVLVMKIAASILSQTLTLADLVERDRANLERENRMLQAEIEQKFSIENLVVHSSSMDKTVSTVQRVAGTDATLLLRGESGTGKTMLAKGVHYASPRAQKAFVVVNCAAIPENLLESELFGHEKGAFTGAHSRRQGKFEAADGGTIFLDEIGELSMEMQAKLLRILQDGNYERLGSNRTLHADIRLICATNADLEDKVRKKNFREDLYYRLMVVPVYIPPLRSRKEDVLPLVSIFLKRFNQKYGKKVSISGEALRFLEKYTWPGNVRELEHTVERVVLLGRDKVTAESEIPLLNPLIDAALESKSADKQGRQGPFLKPARLGRGLYERVPLKEAQIRKALDEAAGIQTLAARYLGVSLRQLRYAVEKYNLDIQSYRT